MMTKALASLKEQVSLGKDNFDDACKEIKDWEKEVLLTGHEMLDVDKENYEPLVKIGQTAISGETLLDVQRTRLLLKKVLG